MITELLQVKGYLPELGSSTVQRPTVQVETELNPLRLCGGRGAGRQHSWLEWVNPPGRSAKMWQSGIDDDAVLAPKDGQQQICTNDGELPRICYHYYMSHEKLCLCVGAPSLRTSNNLHCYGRRAIKGKRGNDQEHETVRQRHPCPYNWGFLRGSGMATP